MSWCFQEDATCVVLREEAWRVQPPSGGEHLKQTEGTEYFWLHDLLLFLSRALLYTRHKLYVLLCVTTPPTKTLPSFAPSSDNSYVQASASAFVSCGPDAWHVCAWLGSKLASLTRQHELTVSPTVLPWETKRFSASGNFKNETFNDHSQPWALQARAAVLQHYSATVQLRLLDPPADKASLADAVPLVIDEGLIFTEREVFNFWPRCQCLTNCNTPLLTSPPMQKPCCIADHLSPSPVSVPTETNKAPFMFEHTIVAGTFDRLHVGHQLLLAAAALATKSTIGLAVAAGPLIAKKTETPEHAAAAGVEPFSYRLQTAIAFLQLVAASRGLGLSVSGFKEAMQEEEAFFFQNQQGAGCTGRHALAACGVRPATEFLYLKVFRLTDPVGPADKLAFDCLVVSKESLQGAKMVNDRRKEGRLDPVFLLFVELVPASAPLPYHINEAFAALFPFPLSGKRDALKEIRKADVPRAAEAASSSGKLDCVSLPRRQESCHVIGASDGKAMSNAPQQAPEVLISKLSSTALRHLQCSRLRCASVVYLCMRFKLAWDWLFRNSTEIPASNGHCAAAVWHAFCAAHAAAWRRLHTFERLERMLQRLPQASLAGNTEPVELCVFIESLLACPSRYITRAAEVCKKAGCNTDKESCSPAEWTPEGEAKAWQEAAIRLLAELQMHASLASEAKTEASAAPCSVPLVNDCGLAGRHALLLNLLVEQRAASFATLAIPAFSREKGKGENKDYQLMTDFYSEDFLELKRQVRRLEQLECVYNAAAEAARLEGLREEYFFVEDDLFRACRAKQLQHMLKDAASFDGLQAPEVLSAKFNIEQELVMLRTASSNAK